MAKFEGHRPPINKLEDLANYIYWQVGTLTMEEVNNLIGVIQLYAAAGIFNDTNK